MPIRDKHCRALLAIWALALAYVSLDAAATPPAPAHAVQYPAETAQLKKLNSPHLPNAICICEKIISGGEPHGDAAFRELAERGVRTVISVDGAKPDVDAAKRFGLRYVHLPHGYDGIPNDRVRELAKAVRDLPGPIYIHCHHGKHRSPAAAAVACVAAGFAPPERAAEILKLAGTDPNYRGLHRAASATRPIDPKTLDALEVEFREVVDVPPIAEAMVALEKTHDQLKRIEEAGWRTPADHPDLAPAHQALLLREHFTELLRTKEVQQKPARFQALLRSSESAAKDLEAALKNDDAAAATALSARIAHNCKTCHAEQRDRIWYLMLEEERNKLKTLVIELDEEDFAKRLIEFRQLIRRYVEETDDEQFIESSFRVAVCTLLHWESKAPSVGKSEETRTIIRAALKREPMDEYIGRGLLVAAGDPVDSHLPFLLQGLDGMDTNRIISAAIGLRICGDKAAGALPKLRETAKRIRHAGPRKDFELSHSFFTMPIHVRAHFYMNLAIARIEAEIENRESSADMPPKVSAESDKTSDVKQAEEKTRLLADALDVLNETQFDYRRVLNKEESKLSELERSVLRQLRASKVPSSDDAKNIAARYKLGHGGLLAQESWRVVGLKRLGRDVKGVGKANDLVWVVRFEVISGRVIGGVTDEYWISANTGKVASVFGDKSPAK